MLRSGSHCAPMLEEVLPTSLVNGRRRRTTMDGVWRCLKRGRSEIGRLQNPSCSIQFTIRVDAAPWPESNLFRVPLIYLDCVRRLSQMSGPGFGPLSAFRLLWSWGFQENTRGQAWTGKQASAGQCGFAVGPAWPLCVCGLDNTTPKLPRGDKRQREMPAWLCHSRK